MVNREKLVKVLESIYSRIYRLEVQNALENWKEEETKDRIASLLLSEVEVRLEKLKSKLGDDEELLKELKDTLLSEAEARYNWYMVELGLAEEEEAPEPKEEVAETALEGDAGAVEASSEFN